MNTDATDDLTPAFSNPLDAPETLSPSEFIAGMLTDREFQIAKMIAMGNDGHDVSKKLGINIKTYDTHRGHILRKLKCKNTVLLAREMLRAGLVTL